MTSLPSNPMLASVRSRPSRKLNNSGARSDPYLL
jgi:hypothetical protein